jgi:uncharacterized protein GlcG (DUF336 family)
MDLLDAAKRLASLVEAEAQRVGIPITFCTIDVHGNVILKQRMTGAALVSIEMSERKAYTSAALPMRTADMSPLAQPGGDLFTLASVAGGRYTMMGGGIPLHLDGKHVAGIGVSGGTVEQDVEIIESALRQFAVAPLSP